MVFDLVRTDSFVFGDVFAFSLMLVVVVVVVVFCGVFVVLWVLGVVVLVRLGLIG